MTVVPWTFRIFAYWGAKSFQARQNRFGRNPFKICSRVNFEFSQWTFQLLGPDPELASARSLWDGAGGLSSVVCLASG